MSNKRERAEKAKEHLKALSEWATQEINDLSNPPGFFYLHMKLQEAINCYRLKPVVWLTLAKRIKSVNAKILIS